MLKRGKLSGRDEEFMRMNASRMSPEKIASRLNRSEQMVRDWIAKNVVRDGGEAVTEEHIDQLADLKTTIKWKRLLKELTKEELDFFSEEYLSLLGQFRGNVLHSEISQIFDVVKFDILMSRNLEQRRKAQDDIASLERMQASFLKRFSDRSEMSDDQRALALDYESRIIDSRSAEQSKTKEFVDLQSRKDALWKSLKGTRDQRVNRADGRELNFMDVIKNLHEGDALKREGRLMELSRMAAEKEYRRLGTPTTYADGSQGNAILSADTVNLGPEEES